MSGTGNPSPEGTSSLSRLLHTESELEAMVADARARADALVQDAEARSRTLLDTVEAELRTALDAARARHAALCAQRISALERDTDSIVARYEAVASSDLDALARWVADQVLHEVAGDQPA